MVNRRQGCQIVLGMKAARKPYCSLDVPGWADGETGPTVFRGPETGGACRLPEPTVERGSS